MQDRKGTQPNNDTSSFRTSSEHIVSVIPPGLPGGVETESLIGGPPKYRYFRPKSPETNGFRILTRPPACRGSEISGELTGELAGGRTGGLTGKLAGDLTGELASDLTGELA